MRKLYIAFAFLLAVLTSCNYSSDKQTTAKIADNLLSQVYKININQDTVLKTLNGALIDIQKGSLSTNGDSLVQLEIKEAYSLQEMIKARLTTQSDGQPLSSSGMIYINAVGGSTIKISKPIKIAVPAKFINDKMKLYKGEQTDSGINWKDPMPLSENPQTKKIDAGEQLFKASCASCHKVDVDFTAPALSYVIKREGKDWVYNYIRHGTKEMNPERSDSTAIIEDNYNSSDTLKNNDTVNLLSNVLDVNFNYISCMRSHFGSLMPTFPSLMNSDLDNIFNYIQNETDRLQVPYPNNNLAYSLDSCENYYRVKRKLLEKKYQLEKDSVKQKIRDYKPPAGYTPSVAPPVYPDNKIEHEDNNSLYYQFTIDVTGWYNIDALLNDFDNKIETELRVRIVGQYKTSISVSLAVPVINTFLEGGKLSGDDNAYGFFTKDGKIPLPKDAKAYIIATGEANGQLVFAKKEFIVSEKQAIDVSPEPGNIESFNASIAAIGSSTIKITAKETVAGKDLKENDKQLLEAEKLKPKNCDCNCWEEK